MPKINIWEKDNTGDIYNENTTTIFVPGEIDIDSVSPDENGCYLITPYIMDPTNITKNIPEELKDCSYIEELIKDGFQILYKYYETISSDSGLDVDFLKDKYIYNIKFLSAGIDNQKQEVLLFQTIKSVLELPQGVYKITVSDVADLNFETTIDLTIAPNNKCIWVEDSNIISDINSYIVYPTDKYLSIKTSSNSVFNGKTISINYSNSDFITASIYLENIGEITNNIITITGETYTYIKNSKNNLVLNNPLLVSELGEDNSFSISGNNYIFDSSDNLIISDDSSFTPIPVSSQKSFNLTTGSSTNTYVIDINNSIVYAESAITSTIVDNIFNLSGENYQIVGNLIYESPAINTQYIISLNYLGNRDTGLVTNPELAKSLASLAKNRGDCCLIGSLTTNFEDSSYEEPILKTLKDQLDDYSLIDNEWDDLNKYIACFASKVNLDNYKTYPDLAYFYAFGSAIQNNNIWESIANSSRGTIDYFDGNSYVSKYNLDEFALTKEGSSFNGLIKLRPITNKEGAIIWGDRTLLKNEGTLKATSFLSIRNMISDIAKRAYQSAITSTFETNNEITWTNFKGRISNLLDEMVANSKLSGYNIVKKPSNNPVEIKCEIHLSTYLPVEDFDIGIILNNTTAEIVE